MGRATFRENGYDFTFGDSDIVNLEEYLQDSVGRPHPMMRAWLFHDHGFTLAVAFATHEAAALEAAADSEKLEHFMLTYDEVKEYERDGREDNISYLGADEEAYDIGTLGIVPLPIVPFSYVALFGSREGY